MPVQIRQRAANGQTGSTFLTNTLGSGGTTPFPANVLAGQTLIISILTSNASANTVTMADNSSQNGAANVYTKDIDGFGTLFGTATRLVVFSCIVTRPILTTDVITATWNVAGNGYSITGIAIVGLVTSGTFLDSVSTVTTDTSGTFTSSADTTTLAKTLVVSHRGMQQSSSGGFFTDTGSLRSLLVKSNAGTAAQVVQQALLEVDASAAYTDSVTYSVVGGDGAIMALTAYKIAPVPPTLPGVPFQYNGFGTS